MLKEAIPFSNAFVKGKEPAVTVDLFVKTLIPCIVSTISLSGPDFKGYFLYSLQAGLAGTGIVAGALGAREIICGFSKSKRFNYGIVSAIASVACLSLALNIHFIR